MAAGYWPAIDIIKQASGELGLTPSATIVATDDAQATLFLALLNSAGNELLTYYPWAQFVKQWTWNTVDGQDSYDLPDDWGYFVDQTQWDRTNRWPLMGPKSAQEWAWLKGGLLQAAPRMRYRVNQNKFHVHPVPGTNPFTLAMEYIRDTWVETPTAELTNMVSQNGDVPQYNPWLLIKFIKLKFYELKGFDSSATRADFMRIFNALTGKDKGGPKLSLAPTFPPLFIGPWSIPDGSWDVSGTGP